MHLEEYRTVAVDAVIFRDNKVLLLHRNRPPFNGCWVLPGGRVEKHETVEAAVMREAREETGLDIAIEKFLGVFSSPQRDPRGTVGIAFRCRVAGGREKPEEAEASELKWFSLNQLPKNLGFDHAEIIKAAQKAPE